MKNSAIEREQSQTCLSSAEREQNRRAASIAIEREQSQTCLSSAEREQNRRPSSSGYAIPMLKKLRICYPQPFEKW